MKLSKLVEEMICASEKAACLARAVCSEESLFKLLVEEKTGDEKNERFVHDFKTLADVLVQETVRHDLMKKFPSLKGNIHGEESNEFTNTLGESVTIEMKETTEETAQLLKKVLNGNSNAASLLASVIHQDLVMDVSNDLSQIEAVIPDGTVGLWIDPIDSTSQYIRNLPSVQHRTGIYTQGLQSVLVLVGAYSLTSGLPVCGVVNQPFTQKHPVTNSWRGTYWWGACYDGTCASSIRPTVRSVPDEEHCVVISASESSLMCDTLCSKYVLVKASGGGYKILCVIQDLASVFLLSRASCYKWDTCSPHAILMSLGGGVLDLRKALDIVTKNKDLPLDKLQVTLSDEAQLKYNKPDLAGYAPGQKWCNTGGLLAYRSLSAAVSLLKVISEANNSFTT